MTSDRALESRDGRDVVLLAKIPDGYFPRLVALRWASIAGNSEASLNTVMLPANFCCGGPMPPFHHCGSPIRHRKNLINIEAIFKTDRNFSVEVALWKSTR